MLVARQDGSVRVEMLDDQGAMVAAGGITESDSIRAAVQWEGEGAEAAVGRRVALRFAMRSAELFSYWFEPQPPVEY